MYASTPATDDSTKISDFCGLIGVVAGNISSNSHTTAFDVLESASYISDRTAFDFTETKSRISDIAKNIDLLNVLTTAEFAGHTYFWCVYDLAGAEPGIDDIFDIERNAIEIYQTMFP